MRTAVLPPVPLRLVAVRLLPSLLCLALATPRAAHGAPEVEVFSSAQDIFAATGVSEVAVNALARRGDGELFAFDTVSRGILRVNPAREVSSLVPRSALVTATGAEEASIRALALSPGGDLFATAETLEGSAPASLGILRIPTTGPDAGQVSVFVTAAAIAAAAAVDRVLLTGLAVAANGDLFASSAIGTPAGLVTGLRGIVRAPTTGPGAGTVTVFVTNDAITAVTGTLLSDLNALATDGAGGPLFAFDGGPSGSRGLLSIQTTGPDAGTVVLCAAEAAITAATGAPRAAITTLAAGSGPDLFAGDAGTGGSDSILKVPTTGPDACTVSVLTPAAALLAATGRTEVDISAAASGSLFVYDGVSDSLLQIATTGPDAGSVGTFVPNSGFFAATGNTASIVSMAGNGDLFAGETVSGSVLQVRTTGPDPGLAEVAITRAMLMAATGGARASPGPLARNTAVTGDLFILETVSGSILRATGGAASPFLSRDAITAFTGRPDVDIAALALNGSGALLILDGASGMDEDTEDAGLLRASIGTGALAFQCTGRQLVADVARALGLLAENVTVSLLAAAVTTENDLLSFDADNEVLLRIGTSSSGCGAGLLASRAALLAATGEDSVMLTALAVDAADTLFAYDDISRSILAIPTTGPGGVSVAVGRVRLLAATGRDEVQVTALAGGAASEVFAFDAVSDAVLRIAEPGVPPPGDADCREPTQFLVIRCQLDRLAAAVREAALGGDLADRLLRHLAAARSDIEGAEEACATGDTERKAGRLLSRALRKVDDLSALVAKTERRGDLPPSVAAQLRARAGALRSLMETVLRAGVCTADQCLPEPVFGAIGCELDRLIAEVRRAALEGSRTQALVSRLENARAENERAEAACPLDGAEARRALRRARGDLRKFEARVRDGVRDGAIPAAVGDRLGAGAQKIEGFIQDLLEAGPCTGL